MILPEAGLHDVLHALAFECHGLFCFKTACLQLREQFPGALELRAAREQQLYAQEAQRLPVAGMG